MGAFKTISRAIHTEKSFSPKTELDIGNVLFSLIELEPFCPTVVLVLLVSGLVLSVTVPYVVLLEYASYELVDKCGSKLEVDW